MLAHDEERAWLLLADGGTPVGAFGNVEDAWAAALPLYAELQRGEERHVDEHLAGGVPDWRLERLPELYGDMLARDLPLEAEEIGDLRRFAGTFTALCEELAGHGIPETLQHDDLHIGNVYVRDGRVVFLDWGDAVVSHPFFSLARADDVWSDSLRDAYLGAWGGGHVETFELALRVGAFEHAFGFLHLWDHLRDDERPRFADAFPRILRRAYCRARADSSTSTRRGFEPS